MQNRFAKPVWSKNRKPPPELQKSRSLGVKSLWSSMFLAGLESKAFDPAGLDPSRVYIISSRPYRTPSTISKTCDADKGGSCFCFHVFTKYTMRKPPDCFWIRGVSLCSTNIPQHAVLGKEGIFKMNHPRKYVLNSPANFTRLL